MISTYYQYKKINRMRKLKRLTKKSNNCMKFLKLLIRLSLVCTLTLIMDNINTMEKVRNNNSVKTPQDLKTSQYCNINYNINITGYYNGARTSQDSEYAQDSSNSNISVVYSMVYLQYILTVLYIFIWLLNGVSWLAFIKGHKNIYKGEGSHYYVRDNNGKRVGITKGGKGANWRKTKRQINREMHARNGNRKGGLRLAHWNMGGTFLPNKMRELEREIQMRQPSIIGISEANLRDDIELNEVNIDGYDMYTSMIPEEGKMKRLVTYVREGLDVKLRDDLMDSNFCSIWLEVNLKQGGKNNRMLICQFYREHRIYGVENTEKREEQWMRWSLFMEQWRSAMEEQEEIHVLGDANFNWKQVNENQGTTNNAIIEATKDIILSQGVTQCVKKNTRYPQGNQNHKPAILDHFYTTVPDKLKNIDVIHTGFSDHSMIIAERYTRKREEIQKYTQKRSYKRFNKDEYLNELRATGWLKLYLSEDVDEAVEIFTNNIKKILDREDMAPIKVFQNRRNYCPWISEETKELMKSRDEAVKRYNENKNEENSKEASRLRKQVTATLKDEKMRSGRKKMQVLENERNTGAIWKTIGSYLNWNKKGGPPTQLIDSNGTLITSPKKMAELQNKFYIDKVKKIREKLPVGGDPCKLLRKMMQNRQRPDRTGDLEFRSVRPEEVEKIIKELKNSSASGTDWIDTAILKTSKEIILPALTHIINLSIGTSKFPEQWKIAKVIPLWKGKDAIKTVTKSYRPVALLPIASKVLERVIHEQINEHMKTNQFWHPNHHAYRKSRNTETAVIQMYDTWVQAIQEGKIATATMIDMSAAFDTVDIEILLEKCRLYNFGEKAEHLLRSYLENRKQLVSIGGKNSEILQLEAGVPQGSILGPIMYTIYTNDFPEVVHEEGCNQGQEEGGSIKFRTMCSECGAVVCFADDSTYTVISSNTNIMTNKVNKKFGEMTEYLGEQRLSVNEDKTHLMLLTTRQKKRNMLNTVRINTEEEDIELSQSEKLLGVELEENMGFDKHIDMIVEKMKTGIKALKAISKIANFTTRKNILNGVITSRLTYMIALWGGTAEYRIDKLQRLQTEALRITAKRRWEVVGRKLVSTRELLKQTGQLSVRQLKAYHTLTQVKKILTEKEPEYMYRRLTENRKHKYSTRRNVDVELIVPETNSRLAKLSFRWRGAELYNSLPREIRDETLTNFKTKTRAWVRENIEI